MNTGGKDWMKEYLVHLHQIQCLDKILDRNFSFPQKILFKMKKKSKAKQSNNKKTIIETKLQMNRKKSLSRDFTGDQSTQIRQREKERISSTN